MVTASVAELVKTVPITLLTLRACTIVETVAVERLSFRATHFVTALLPPLEVAAHIPPTDHELGAEVILTAALE
jgi:hypothetical protein